MTIRSASVDQPAQRRTFPALQLIIAAIILVILAPMEPSALRTVGMIGASIGLVSFGFLLIARRKQRTGG